MAKPLFTPEELEELRQADKELDADFQLTPEDRTRSQRMDRLAKLEAMDNKQRKVAAYKAAYYRAHREKCLTYKREHSKKRKATTA